MDNRTVEVSDKEITVKDSDGFPLVKIMPDKIKVKEEVKVIRI